MRRKNTHKPQIYLQEVFDEEQLNESFNINLLETCLIYRVQYPII